MNDFRPLWGQYTRRRPDAQEDLFQRAEQQARFAEGERRCREALAFLNGERAELEPASDTV